MIQTYSTTIRRKEMDAVLTCMVDEKIGPGELNLRFLSSVKEFFNCDGAVALRSPHMALKYALRALEFNKTDKVMISSLAPSWHYTSLVDLGYDVLVLDVNESTGLVTPEIISKGIENGGKLLLLHETNGILPDFLNIMALNIPVIEDISQSAGAVYSFENPDAPDGIEKRKAGLFGLYTILSLEEKDVLTSGGGSVLMAPKRKEWSMLKKYTDEISKVELLPDINCALAWIQLKEFPKNEMIRKEIYNIYYRASLSGKHKVFLRSKKSDSNLENVSMDSSDSENEKEKIQKDLSSTVSNFPLILSSPYKDVKMYAQKKEIQISQTFEDSVIALKQEELSSSCIKAKSLYLRCADFPLYPRLSHSQVAKIAKILGTLP